jgi:hypothetical protein
MSEQTPTPGIVRIADRAVQKLGFSGGSPSFFKHRDALAAVLMGIVAPSPEGGQIHFGDSVEELPKDPRDWPIGSTGVSGGQLVTKVAATPTTPAPDDIAEGLREALEWALAEIEGRTKYLFEEQRENALECAHKALSGHQPSIGQGWIVLSGDGKRYRAWADGWSAWTDDRENATRYARRKDAEAVHAEDEDAWFIQPYASLPQLLADRAGFKAGMKATSAQVATLTARVGALEGAGRAVIVSRDEHAHEQERFVTGGDYGDYWSPNASMASSESFAALRAALASDPAVKPSAEGGAA